MTRRSVRMHLLQAATMGMVAGFGLILASSGPGLLARLDRGDLGADDVVAFIGFAVFVVAGAMAVRAGSRAARLALQERSGEGRAAPLATVLSIGGYVILGMTALGMLDGGLEGLLLGGALTGIVLGIAAQQTLGNVFAGLVLMIVRPFSVGERTVVRAGAIGGEYEGVVGDMGLFYVEMMTDGGLVLLPNSSVLAAAVGPGARTGGQVAEEEPVADAPTVRKKTTRLQTPPKRRSRET